MSGLAATCTCTIKIVCELWLISIILFWIIASKKCLYQLLKKEKKITTFITWLLIELNLATAQAPGTHPPTVQQQYQKLNVALHD